MTYTIRYENIDGRVGPDAAVMPLRAYVFTTSTREPMERVAINSEKVKTCACGTPLKGTYSSCYKCFLGKEQKEGKKVFSNVSVDMRFVDKYLVGKDCDLCESGKLEVCKGAKGLFIGCDNWRNHPKREFKSGSFN